MCWRNLRVFPLFYCQHGRPQSQANPDRCNFQPFFTPSTVGPVQAVRVLPGAWFTEPRIRVADPWRATNPKRKRGSDFPSLTLRVRREPQVWTAQS